MKFRRVRDKNTKKGLFCGYKVYDLRGTMTSESDARFNYFNNDHDSTKWIPQIKEGQANHYFKTGYYNKHKSIITEIVKGVEDFELIVIDKRDIKRIWFEDDKQIIAELY